MTPEEEILRLFPSARSKEEAIKEVDEFGMNEFITALEAKGRLFDLDDNRDLEHLDDVVCGAILMMYELHRMPSPEVMNANSGHTYY